jgi:dimeric dUTPase (all-alpha-NTP-PPase superfamily)
MVWNSFTYYLTDNAITIRKTYDGFVAVLLPMSSELNSSSKSYGNIAQLKLEVRSLQTKLKIMLELQDSMNSRVNSSWREQGFEWYRAIWVECAELMDHYGWKWWKHQAPDMEQVKLELIDIWHFGLSNLLQDEVDPTIILMEIQECFGTDKKDGFKELLERFAEYTLVEKEFSIPLFIALLEAVDMSFDDLYCGYVGKNVLNFFRQDHGYKEGTYTKIWNNKEDNEHLVEIMGELELSDKEFTNNLYASLEARYQKCVEST